MKENEKERDMQYYRTVGNTSEGVKICTLYLVL
jgi:hypothetical protein